MYLLVIIYTFSFSHSLSLSSMFVPIFYLWWKSIIGNYLKLQCICIFTWMSEGASTIIIFLSGNNHNICVYSNRKWTCSLFFSLCARIISWWRQISMVLSKRIWIEPIIKYGGPYLIIWCIFSHASFKLKIFLVFSLSILWWIMVI